MAITLYYAPNTRASRPRWLLEELGVDYELRRLDLAAREHKQAEYLAIHPLGLVPALVADGVAMFESAAICLYLADRFADRGLAPALDDPQRGPYLQWVMFSQTSLEPPILAYWKTTPDSDEAAAAKARFDTAAAVLATALADRPHILGDRFSAADIMLGGATAWARHFGLLADHPMLLDYGRRVGSREAARRARAD